MSCFVTYFAHPKNPYLTISYEGETESTSVFIRKDDSGRLTVEGLPPIEEGVDGWETLKVSKNGVEYIHNKTPFEVEYEGLNATTRIASRAILRRAASEVVHLTIKRAQAPAETL